MKLKYLFIGAIALSFTLKTVSAQLPPTNRVDKLHRELQWAIENENPEKARKITDLLIQELARYRQQLSIYRERNLERDRRESTRKKPFPSQNRPQPNIDRERNLERHRRESTRKKPFPSQNRPQPNIDRERNLERDRRESTRKKPFPSQNRPQPNIDRERNLERDRRENTRKKPIQGHLDRNRPQFGKQLILEKSAAYGSDAYVCVTGQIRNNSRSPMENDVYAIAHFFDAQKRYLGSQTQQIDPQSILPNQTVNFDLTTSQPKQLSATVVKLQFKGTSSEGSIGLHPTNKSKMILPISSSTNKCVI